MSQHLDQLFQKEMSRSEFIATLGLSILSIFGFSHIIHLFTGKSVEDSLSNRVDDVSVHKTYGGQ